MLQRDWSSRWLSVLVAGERDVGVVEKLRLLRHPGSRGSVDDGGGVYGDWPDTDYDAGTSVVGE